ncbi:hypothetical protein [Desertivirga xinjiangensis]|uniref:hypothetical protein n=1 Tax=Desertivirga xinjiangensis TaxID=539206 RepID=UPI00210C860B|nr:hypothetical protein [Pedobacter xinjiangensis]
MQQQSFNYREQLITIFHCLQETVDGMYAHAFDLALSGELRFMNDVLEHGDEIPGDLNYLKALKCPVVNALVELIEDIFELQESMFNINALSLDDIMLPEDEPEVKMEEWEPQFELGPAWLEASGHTYGSLLVLYRLVWQLANESLDEPDEVIEKYERSFYEEDLCLTSLDANVNMILNTLNTILRKNRMIDYCDAEGQREK